MQKKAIGSTIICLFIAFLIYFSLAKGSLNNILSFHDTTGKLLIEEQIKFDVVDTSVFEEIKGQDHILSYKSKFKGTYNYEDYYYDTPGLDLFKLGYAYRLRIRNKGQGNLEYGIQFKKEYDAKDPENFVRSEIDDVIPEDIAKNMLSGDLSKAFSGDYDFLTINKFRSFLEENKIDYHNLVPLLHCLQKRERFRLKEHSLNYFEISLDDVLFTTVKGNNKQQIHFYQLEFENKLKGAIARDIKRIEQLIRFFTDNYRLKITRESKYRKAVLELIRE